MSPALQPTPPFVPTTDSQFREALERLGTLSVFKDVDHWEIIDDPWRRPVRPQAFKYVEFDPICEQTHLDYMSLTTNRLLTALNELDFVFLPSGPFALDGSFSTFYSDELEALANHIRPRLDDNALGFVSDNVSVRGVWTKAQFEEYFQDRVLPLSGEVPRSFALATESNYPVQAAELLLIQHAVDFLTEASHMARYTLGDYGPLQSQLFRVLLDEFGYGVHDTKHSTLFKRALESVGLQPGSHAHWQFYLTSTLLLNNYFHRITARPRHLFRYLGAITLAENTFGPYCRAFAGILKGIYGDDVDVRYYTEHAHIDKHHGRMTYEGMLLPAIDRYGPGIIREIVLGIEETLYLQGLAERDLEAQLSWMSKKDAYHELGMEIRDQVLADQDRLSITRLIEPKGELSVTHVHDGDELCIVNEGVLRFVSGPNSFVDLQPGQAVVIRKNRLHGAIVLSDECRYNIYSIGNYRRYADRDV